MKRNFYFWLCATLLILAAPVAIAQGTLYVSQTSTNPTPPYATWDTAAHTIQEAVDAASDGDTVLVAAGDYRPSTQGIVNLVTINKAIVLRSESGPGQTTINATWDATATRCLWMSNSLAVVEGFTMIRGTWGGNDLAAGVVMIGGVLSNCTVTRVSAPWSGGRLVHCSGGGLITDCNIDGNSRNYAERGAGVYLIESELRNSTISKMYEAQAYSGAREGAGVYAISSTISGCVITNNTAGDVGGGAYLDGCVMDRCIITGNQAGQSIADWEGRGGGLFATNSVIRNTLIARNRASNGYQYPHYGLPGFGGGVYLQGGSLLNCTLTGNQAADAGGIYAESVTVRNSIVYFNGASTNANWYNAGGSFDHSCTTPDPGGAGNLVEDPQFVDQTNGNYRLAQTSPCIDAGVNEAWMSGAQDLDGNPRIGNGTVDLGGWERPPVPVVTWIAPTNGTSFPAESDIRMTARATDPDGSVSFVEFFANSANLGQVVSATDVYEFIWSNAPSGPYRLHAEAVDDAGGRSGSDSVLIVVGATEPAATLGNPSPGAGDNAGRSAAISGTRAVVGAHRDDTGTRNAGSAYVYDLTGATPTEPVIALTNPSQQEDKADYFGSAVAISDTRVVVAARGGDTGQISTGRAYVYDVASATPTVPVATLDNPSGRFDFGASVAISGTRVVVGQPRDGPHPQVSVWNAGRAFVFDLTSGTPTAPIATLTNPSPETDDAFGYSVAASGTRVVVGEPYADDSAPNAGNAYVYDLGSAPPPPGVIPSVTTLTNPSPATNAFFGYAVAFSGTRVAVGAYGAGRVYVYDLVTPPPLPAATVLVATLTNPSPATNDFFGSSVAISGTRIVVGAYHHEVDPTGAPGAGSTYVYDLASVTPTVPVATLNNPSPAADDRFGFSVGVSDARVLVGAPNDDFGATDAGSVYFYDFASSTNDPPNISPPSVQFASPQVNNGFFRSTISGLPEQGTLIIEISTDLIEWQPVQTNTITGDAFELVEPINPTSPSQFFRALIRD